MAVRKPEPQPAPASEPTVLEIANARAICRLAVKLPGRNASIEQILTLELGLSGDDAQAIITAAGSGS